MFKRIILSSLVLLFFVALPITTQAQSIDELKAIIASLKAQIEELQRQMDASSKPASCYNFGRYVAAGHANNKHEDVVALHKLLVKEGFLPAEFSNADEYTDDTASAVVDFQQKYGIQRTGFVGPKTRAKLNALCTGGRGGNGINSAPHGLIIPVRIGDEVGEWRLSVTDLSGAQVPLSPTNFPNVAVGTYKFRLVTVDSTHGSSDTITGTVLVTENELRLSDISYNGRRDEDVITLALQNDGRISVREGSDGSVDAYIGLRQKQNNSIISPIRVAGKGPSFQFPAGADYPILIQDADNSESLDDSVFFFQISPDGRRLSLFSQKSNTEASKPSITVKSPNGGETWEVKSNQTIRWSTNNVTSDRSAVDIILVGKNNEMVQRIADDAPNTGSYSFYVPSGFASGTYKVFIGVDGQSISDYSDSLFTVIGTTSTNRPLACGERGDLDGNGVINQTDYDLEGKAVSGTQTFPLSKTDINGDGVVSTTDWVALGRYVEGLDATLQGCTVSGTLNIALVNLPTTSLRMGSNTLYRYKVTASGRDMTLSPQGFTMQNTGATFSQLELRGYSDVGYTTPISTFSTPTLAQLNPPTGTTISTTLTPTQPVVIPVGQTRYFELVGSVTQAQGSVVVSTALGAYTPQYLEGSFTTTQPKITVLSPNGGETYKIGDVIPVSFDGLSLSGIGPFEVALINASGAVVAKTNLSTWYNNGKTTVQFNIPSTQIAPVPAGQYTFKACDNNNTANPLCDSSNFSFFITEPTSNRAPIGAFDLIDCTQLAGWSYDPDVSSDSIKVKVFRDGLIGSGIEIINELANGSRPDVNTQYVITGLHGFSFMTPTSLKDGASHQVYMYGIDSAGGIPTLLQHSPRTISCPVSAVPFTDSELLTNLMDILSVNRGVTTSDAYAHFDLNNDLRVDNSDLIILRTYTGQSETVFDTIYRKTMAAVDARIGTTQGAALFATQYDTNRNGTIDIVDRTRINTFLIGVRGKPLACGERGDLDGNGYINQADYDVLGKVLGGTATSPLSRADINASGTITNSDWVGLGAYIGGTLTTLPGCSVSQATLQQIGAALQSVQALIDKMKVQ